MGTRLNRDLILKAHDLGAEEVHVPEWADPETGADTVLVRGMTGKERDAFEVSLMQPGRNGRNALNPSNLRAKMVARCVVDDAGDRLFTDADVADLGDHSAAAIDRVYTVAARLSGMSDKDQENLTRDFALADGEGSSSTSPPGSAKRSKGS